MKNARMPNCQKERFRRKGEKEGAEADRLHLSVSKRKSYGGNVTETRKKFGNALVRRLSSHDRQLTRNFGFGNCRGAK